MSCEPRDFFTAVQRRAERLDTRLCVGIEHIDDILADLEQSLA